MPEITVTPLKVRELPGFINVLKPIFALLAESKTDDLQATSMLVKIVTEHPENIITAVQIATRADKDWLDDQGIDVLVELAIKVIEVNSDFFMTKMLSIFSIANPAVQDLLTTSTTDPLPS